MNRTSVRIERSWVAASICAGALLLAGCGSSAVTASSGTTATSSAAATASSMVVSSTAAAAESGVTIADTWVKSTVGTADPSMTAAFGVLTNHTDKDLTIVSATNDVTDHTELHEMAMVDGAMVMRPKAGGIPIPANGSTTLSPGGLHVMIMDAKAPIAPGDDVHVTLTLSDGSTMLFHATAKEFAGANESYNGGTSGAMDMSSSTAPSSHDDDHTETTHSDG